MQHKNNKSSYELIADEYYDHTHVTSRNLDSATLEFCNDFNFEMPSEGLVLELGCGKGCSGKYCKVESKRIIQLDISRSMLRLDPREDCIQRILGDALKIPFKSSSFSIVTAFLYDPYNKDDLYMEISRVLKPNGVFIGTLPHSQWLLTLRKEFGYPLDKTKFLTNNNIFLEFNSFLSSDEEIKTKINLAGFKKVRLYEIYLPKGTKKISPDIEISANKLGIDVNTFSILTLIMARK